MKGLAALQRAFQARILDHRHGIEAQLAGHDAPDFTARLRTYVDGYRARLIEALGTTYAALRATVGDEEFARLIGRYVEATPSRHPSVRHHGAGVADLLRQELAGEAGVTLAELAHWEWTLAAVFDAPDDAPLGNEALGAVPPQAWGEVSFRFRASLRSVTTHSNAVDYWRAANDQGPVPAAFALTPGARWILWRRGLATFFRSVDPVEQVALEAAAAGEPFAMLCERLAAGVGAEQAALRAASLLRGWFAEELVAGIRHGH
jgi:hypothetical protein